jgi:hypothetical protein
MSFFKGRFFKRRPFFFPFTRVCHSGLPGIFFIGGLHSIKAGCFLGNVFKSFAFWHYPKIPG